MRVAFIDYVFELDLPVGTSGLSEVVWNMAIPLANAGHEVHVVAPYASQSYPCDSVQVHRFELPPIGYRNIIGHILIVRRAIQILKNYGQFDVIHAPEYLSTALLCYFGRIAPIILTEPGNIYERIANGNPYDYVTTQVYKWSARVSAKSCARIIATSDEMAYWWQRSGAQTTQIARIPLGVNLEGFSPIPQARQKLGWSSDQKHILFVARLSPETGAAALLRAFPQVVERYPEAHVHLVGSGVEVQKLRRLAEELAVSEKVHWYGWIPLHNLATYYSAADVMVFPGTSGGTPRVMLQAMACGVPFVGSAIGGIVDHIDASRTGWLVPAGNIEQLADAITQVFAHPADARQRAENAREYVLSVSWPAIADRVYREVYQLCQQEVRSC